MGFEIPISLPLDEDGLIGRECPQPDCEGYFKIKFGTGIKEPGYETCFCPYCGNVGKQGEFFTKEQVNYIEGIASRHIQGIIEKEVRKWDRQLRSSTRGSFIKLSMDYKKSHLPLAHYAEREVETKLVCENCTLEYAIYGKFAKCPDCGVANSLQIFNANIAMIEKLLFQAETQSDRSFQEYLIQNALEDVISSFDSFGRNTLTLSTQNIESAGSSISFQNIAKAKEKAEKQLGFDISQGLSEDEWKLVIVLFQKRHIISHNDGIIDGTYIQITGDNTAIPGRKVAVSIDEVRSALQYISVVANSLVIGLSRGNSRE